MKQMRSEKALQNAKYMNKTYLIFIIFIATSFHTIFGMNDAELIPLSTPFFLKNQESPATVYITSSNQRYKQILPSGKISEKEESDLDFFTQKQNICTMITSTKDSSYGVFNQESKNFACLEDFRLTQNQLTKIESFRTIQLVVIWHANKRYDIHAIEKIDQNFAEQMEFTKAKIKD